MPKKQAKDKIVICIEGGVLQGVNSNINANVVLVDMDDLTEQGLDSSAREDFLNTAISGLELIY